jgi:integrase
MEIEIIQPMKRSISPAKAPTDAIPVKPPAPVPVKETQPALIPESIIERSSDIRPARAKKRRQTPADTDLPPSERKPKQTWRFKDHPDFLIEPDYFMERWRAMPSDPRHHKHRALMALAFMTGARISELLLMRRMHIKLMDKTETGLEYPIVLLTIPTLKKRVGAEGKERRAIQNLRKCALPTIGDYQPLTQCVLSYVETIPSPFHYLFPTNVKAMVDTDGRPFPMSAKQAWCTVKKWIGKEASCHLFRHSLSTRMVERREWDAYDLKAWYNWSSEGLKMAGQYVTKNWKKIARKTGYRF